MPGLPKFRCLLCFMPAWLEGRDTLFYWVRLDLHLALVYPSSGAHSAGSQHLRRSRTVPILVSACRKHSAQSS